MNHKYRDTALSWDPCYRKQLGMGCLLLPHWGQLARSAVSRKHPRWLPCRHSKVRKPIVAWNKHLQAPRLWLGINSGLSIVHTLRKHAEMDSTLAGSSHASVAFTPCALYLEHLLSLANLHLSFKTHWRSEGLSLSSWPASRGTHTMSLWPLCARSAFRTACEWGPSAWLSVWQGKSSRFQTNDWSPNDDPQRAFTPAVPWGTSSHFPFILLGLVNNILLPINLWVRKEKLAVAPKYTAAWNLYGNINISQATAFPNLKEATDLWERTHCYPHLIG